MVKAVLFDFDGVIVRSEPLHMRTFMDLLKPWGVEIQKERWYREFAGTGSGRIFRRLTEEYGIDADVSELVEKRRKMFIEHARSGELEEMPGLRAFLSLLRGKGISMAIVSGGHRSYIELLLKLLGMESFFGFIVSAEDLPARKPDPEPFLHAARKLGAAPSDCLVLEDSYSGCQAARSAGMKLVWVRPDPSMEPPECDLVVDDLRDEGIMALL